MRTRTRQLRIRKLLRKPNSRTLDTPFPQYKDVELQEASKDRTTTYSAEGFTGCIDNEILDSEQVKRRTQKELDNEQQQC
jgi:hypothetical protein